jgi:hypothetical protein
VGLDNRVTARTRAVAIVQRRVTAAEAARRRAAAGRLFVAPHDAHVRSWQVYCWDLIESYDADDGPLSAEQEHDLDAFDAWRLARRPKHLTSQRQLP